MTINLSQVVLDLDVKTKLISTYDVIPTSGRNLGSKYNLSNQIGE